MKTERRTYKDQREPVMLRLPAALKAWLVERARRARRSITAEAELILRKEQER